MFGEIIARRRKMKKLIFILIMLFLFIAQTYSYAYILPVVEDTFTDSFFGDGLDKDNKWIGYSDYLWAGPTVNYDLAIPAIDGTEFTHTYLKFDLTGLNNITDARLYLYRKADVWTYNDPDVGNIMVYYETKNGWSEDTLKWNIEAAGPNFEDDVAGFTRQIGPWATGESHEGWYSWNVTSFAQLAEGGKISLVLAKDAPGEVFHIFYSSESGVNTPYLSVSANPVPEPASVLLFGIGTTAMAIIKRRKKTF
ncbi:MAG: hypothetical protein A2Y03_01825 [Omnitrophica WOR_2 bacterium GWF2_38_59]|nr:MAG: hypothetical protein A2Y03_01825 [Omnitrophica WOR_2 bacterium GWF2_38_59]